MESHYGWYIAIEPNSGEYFIDKDNIQAHKKVFEKYPNAKNYLFCINETGTTGRI